MAFLKKHYFWVFCGVLTVVALGAWAWTTMDMSARYVADKTKIEQGYSLVNGVNGIQDHPNKITEDAMNERIKALKLSVARAWQEQYLEQEKVFVWPATFPNKMRRDLAKLRPIEKEFSEFPTPPGKELLPEWLAYYSNYMADELPKLADTIGAKWKVNPDMLAGTGSGGMEGYGGGYSSGASSGYSPYSGATSEGSGSPGAVEEERPVVDWNVGNQTEIYNLRFNWAARPNSAPTTMEMLYAQEDFWTLQSLMDIIRRTNGDADAYYEALVKEIQFIRIGAAAVRSDAMITPMASASAAAGTMTSGMPIEGSSSGDPYAMPGPEGSMGADGMPMPGSEMGPGSGGVAVAIDPAAGRYVDNAYKPLTAEELRASLTTTDPTKAYLAVAKRMPVRMRVRMDQRYLSRLLIECANAPLTLEVRQVRINPGTSGAVTTSYGGSSSGGNPYGASGGFGAMSSSGMSESASSGMSGYGDSSGSGPGAGGPGTSFDAVVEIYGIVYIYNPPVKGPLDVVDPNGGGETAPATPAGETLTSVN